MTERHKTLEESAIDIERAKRNARRVVNAEERGQVTPPEILTLRERLDRPRPVQAWRIAQLQRCGQKVLLAAQFKAGKTTLIMNVAAALLDGFPLLDAFDVAPIEGVIVVFDFEMSPGQLDDWYRDLGIQHDDRVIIIPMKGAAALFNIVDADVRAGWAARLKAAGVKYLFLDCLRPVLDALGLNEHTEAGVFLTALDTLLRDAEIPEALVVQHMGHTHERARGDSRLLDWPDVGWTLVREKEDDPASARFFKAYGRDVDVPETQLTYNPHTRRLGVAGGTRADAQTNAKHNTNETHTHAVWEFVTRHPGCLLKEIREAVGGSPEKVRKALEKLDVVMEPVARKRNTGNGYFVKPLEEVKCDM